MDITPRMNRAQRRDAAFGRKRPLSAFASPDMVTVREIPLLAVALKAEMRDFLKTAAVVMYDEQNPSDPARGAEVMEIVEGLMAAFSLAEAMDDVTEAMPFAHAALAEANEKLEALA